MIGRYIRRFLVLAAILFAPMVGVAYDSPTNILTGVTDAFDMSSSTGLGILGFFLTLGVVLSGIAIYRKRR